jgi:hypothetical protein
MCYVPPHARQLESKLEHYLILTGLWLCVLAAVGAIGVLIWAMIKVASL